MTNGTRRPVPTRRARGGVGVDPDAVGGGVVGGGGSAAVTYSVTVNNPGTGDLVLDNTVISATAGSNCPDGSADPACTATVDVVDATTLTFTKTADVASAPAGGTVAQEDPARDH